MAKICYVPRKFSADKARLIELMDSICNQYLSLGYDLTVRQMYYQFVSKSLIANQPEEYSKLQSLLNDARLAGLIDWDHIVDRTRNLMALRHWESPRALVAESAETFATWRWENQPNYVEVWVEKDALKSIVASACNPLDVPYFSCRGYTSVSEMHGAALRLKHEVEHGKTVRLIHLGDHDPSGLDMTRDIKERLNNVFRVPVKVYRVALNKDQVERYQPPPNPAKITDSRATKYIERHGDYSWELDALDATVLANLIEANILHWRDEGLWTEATKQQTKGRGVLNGITQRWHEVEDLLAGPPRDVE